jgi:hypothetical protein
LKKTNCPISKLGRDDGHYFFGYYDKCPWNENQQKLLAHRASFIDRFPAADDEVEIGYFDPERPGSFTLMSTTTAWNWQQGSQLQWVTFGGVEKAVFNKRYDDGVFATAVDPSTHQEIRLGSSVYTISSVGSVGLTLNYGRLFDMRQDYGLAGIADAFADELMPQNDGIYRFDLPHGSPELVLSIADVAALEVNPMGEGRKHWVNHLMFNPSGRRFCFLHRFERTDGIVHSRLMSANQDGSDLRLLFEGLVSHYDWLDENRIFAWAGRRSLLSGGSGKKGGLGSMVRKCLKPIYYALGKPRILMQKIVGDSYFIIDDAPVQNSCEVAKGILTSDGHCTVSPDGKWVLTDGYTDADNRLPLFLWDLEKQEAMELARFDTPKHLDGPLRVDLHPRFSRDGKKICIDSAMDGSRNMYVLDVAEQVGN